MPVGDEGYRLAYELAGENLRAGVSVVADSCNPVALTRMAWMDIAREAAARFQNIEITCSDPFEHQGRVEGRPAEVPGLKLPTWEEVLKREYEAWSGDRIVLDTAKKTIEACFKELLGRLENGMA